MSAKYELNIDSGYGGNITIDAQPFHDCLQAHGERPSPLWQVRAKQLSQFVGFTVNDWQIVELSDFEDEDGNFLYPAGTCVGVEYEGEVDGEHYFSVQVGQKPAVIVRESNLIEFVL